MNENDASLLEKATGIPIKSSALFDKARKQAAHLPDDIITKRVGEEGFQRVRELVADPASSNGDKTLEGAAAALSGEGSPEEGTEENGSLPEHITSLTRDDLEQKTKNELKDLATELGLPKSGTVNDLFNRIGSYLGIVEDG